MEFVDYKCLESLLIEGEELIATEGFIDTDDDGLAAELSAMF